MAVHELLYRARRRPVQLGNVLDELKCRAEFRMKGVRVVTNDVEAAAAERSLRAERGNDDMPTDLDGARHLAHIRRPCLWVGQEMKDGAVMPDIVLPRTEWSRRDIATDPRDLVASVAETMLRDLERDWPFGPAYPVPV